MRRCAINPRGFATMSVRNLESLFHPRSVAVIGASDRPGSVGAVVLANLDQGGFAGPVWPVNVRHATVGGRPAWPDVRVEEEPLGSTRCLQDYGHGGTGVALAWGCARDGLGRGERA